MFSGDDFTVWFFGLDSLYIRYVTMLCYDTHAQQLVARNHLCQEIIEKMEIIWDIV